MVIRLRSRKARDRRRAGGKAAGLARLIAERFPVPNGFVIPVSDVGAEDDRWRERAWRAASRLRQPLAVRSSMVGEDDLNRSFAGQLETVIGVEGREPFLRALDVVLASAARLQSAPYAAGAPIANRMAVVVQELVAAKAAGVAFSHDPMTGRPFAIIEAVPGLGDELVRGRCAPDRFAVDPRGMLALEQRSALDEHGLPPEVVLRVAALARRAADCFGAPQDVEWAWDGEQIFVLQSRPITSLAGKRIYSRKLVGDMSPGCIKPLVWSTTTVGMARGVFREVFTCLLGRNDHDFGRLLHRIRSHVYMDSTFMGELLSEAGLPRNFFEAVGREEKVSRRVKPSLRLIARTPRIVAFLQRYGRMERELAAAVARHDGALERFRRGDWSGLGATELLARVDELLALHRGMQRCIFFASMNLAVRNRLLRRFVARHAPEVDASRLLLGLRGLRSVVPNRELQAIAARTGPLCEPLAELLLSGNDRAIREALAEDPRGAALAAEVDGFLDRFGYLGAYGTNFGEPTWAEEPSPLWLALGRLAGKEGPSTRDPAPVREEARRRVLARLGPLRRRRFLARLDAAARYLELREETSRLMTEDGFQLRRLCLALGRRLVGQAALEAVDDVFLLDHDELHDLVHGRAAAGLGEAVRRRRDEIEADRRAELPETVLGDEVPSTAADPGDGKVLTGIPASAGVIRGTARVVRELADAPARLAAGDVLVVPFSDVGWTPLFAAVGGIVAECGGQLSHTAIVAREYGLPAVVGVRGAMKLIRDGQAITVDGGAGRVFIEEDAQP